MLELHAGDVARRVWYGHTAGILLAESLSSGFVASEAGPDSKLLSYGAMGFFVLTMIASSSKRRLEVGEHMTLGLHKYRAFRNRSLSDGVVIRPGDSVGTIHFNRQMPPLKTGESWVKHTRDLADSAQKSLTELAQLCSDNHPDLEDIQAFYGVSHLAGPFAKRFGFDVFPIKNPISLVMAYRATEDIYPEGAEKNKAWMRYQKNWRLPQEAFISRGKLVSNFV